MFPDEKKSNEMVMIDFSAIGVASAFQHVRLRGDKQAEVQSWSGKSNLVVLLERQNSEDYIHVVAENLLAFAYLNHGTQCEYT